MANLENPSIQQQHLINCPICGQKTYIIVNSKRDNERCICCNCHLAAKRQRDQWAVTFPYLKGKNIDDFAIFYFLLGLNGKLSQLSTIFAQGQQRFEELQREKERCTRDRRRCKERYERDYAI